MKYENALTLQNCISNHVTVIIGPNLVLKKYDC